MGLIELEPRNVSAATLSRMATHRRWTRVVATISVQVVQILVVGFGLSVFGRKGEELALVYSNDVMVVRCFPTDCIDCCYGFSLMETIAEWIKLLNSQQNYFRYLIIYTSMRSSSWGISTDMWMQERKAPQAKQQALSPSRLRASYSSVLLAVDLGGPC
jgi:hypothetical protein